MSRLMKYEGVDKNDEIEKAFFSCAAKKESKLQKKEKNAGTD